jgi:hypothetical protein
VYGHNIKFKQNQLIIKIIMFWDVKNGCSRFPQNIDIECPNSLYQWERKKAVMLCCSHAPHLPLLHFPSRESPSRYVQISVPLCASKSTVLVHLCFSTKLHSITSQKTIILILSIVRSLKSHLFSSFRDELHPETESEITENIPTLSLVSRKVN